MKKYLVIIVVFLIFSAMAQGQDMKAIKKYRQLIGNSCMSDMDIDALSVKYWKLKGDFENYFIEYSVSDLNKLTNDGIGEWDAEKCAYE